MNKSLRQKNPFGEKLAYLRIRINIKNSSTHCNYSENVVGVAGFEPATPSPPVKCATRLRHTPTMRATYAPRLSCAMGFAPIRRAPAGS